MSIPVNRDTLLMVFELPLLEYLWEYYIEEFHVVKTV